MFMLGNMAIDAIVAVVIMVSLFAFAYILTAILGEARDQRRSRSARRRRSAPRQA